MPPVLKIRFLEFADEKDLDALMKRIGCAVDASFMRHGFIQTPTSTPQTPWTWETTESRAVRRAAIRRLLALAKEEWHGSLEAKNAINECERAFRDY